MSRLPAYLLRLSLAMRRRAMPPSVAASSARAMAACTGRTSRRRERSGCHRNNRLGELCAGQHLRSGRIVALADHSNRGLVASASPQPVRRPSHPGPQARLPARSHGAARRGDRDHQLRGRTDVSPLRLRTARRHDVACIDRSRPAVTSPGHWLMNRTAAQQRRRGCRKDGEARSPSFSLNNLPSRPLRLRFVPSVSSRPGVWNWRRY